MSVDAIGSTVGSGTAGIDRTGLQTEDFLKLFLAQLTFQDPLKPVDNTEFLAQLAQFTGIQQTQVLSDNMGGLLTVQSSAQTLALLGRTVEVTANNQSYVGTVTTVSFAGGEPVLTIKQADETLLQAVKPSTVTLVR